MLLVADKGFKKKTLVEEKDIKIYLFLKYYAFYTKYACKKKKKLLLTKTIKCSSNFYLKYECES